VRVWDLDACALLHTLTGHKDRVLAVAVSADGRAVSGGADETVRVWDLDAGALLHTLTGHKNWVLAVAVSADGRRAVSSSGDGTVQVWNLATDKKVAPASRWPRHKSARPKWLTSQCLSVSTDGRRAVSGNGVKKRVRVWDLDTGEPLRTLTGHHGGVYAVAVSADGHRAVSGGVDRTVRVWDLEKGLELASFVSDSEIIALAATPPGTRVIVGTSTGAVHLLALSGNE
jgi:WD40 repeat protein